MKEKQNHKRFAGMRGRTKRYIAAVIAIVLTLAFSAIALADKGNGGGAQPPNGPDAQSGATQKPPQGNNGSSTGNGNQKDKRSKAKIGAPNLDKIAEAIAALTDETVKADLTALLSAYEAAWTAKQDAVAANETDTLATLTDAITSAKAALDAALATAGIPMDTVYGAPVEALDGTAHRNRRPVLDADQILAAIATLDDTNADKATLTSLLETYQDALAAMQAADTTALSEEEQQTLAFALRQAEEALLLASREAGLIGGNGRGQFVSGYAFGQAELDVTSILTSIAALEDTDENKATLTTLFEAYNVALAAEAAADKTAMSDAEFDALHDATQAAEKALIDALALAGIEVPVLDMEDPPTDSAATDADDDDDETEEEDDD